MTAVTRPRGPLPPRVYWTRRLLLLGFALLLVFGIAHLVGGGSPASGPSAQPVGADESTPASMSATSGSPTPSVPTGSTPPTGATAPTGAPTGRSDGALTGPTPTATGRGGRSASALAQPTGPCPSSDVVAVPAVTGRAFAVKPVVLTVRLTSRATPACTWEVSPSSLALKITSGADRVWSTQDCPASVPRRAVVLRRDVPTAVNIIWNGQRSDTGCTRTTPWALRGYYHAVVAAFGADPRDVQFRLGLAPPGTETASPTPTGSPTASATASPTPTRSTSPHPGAPPAATGSSTPTPHR